jgi:hypothetical protein
MQNPLMSAAALHFTLGVAMAQPAAMPGNQSLSLDQQSKISEIVTNQTPQPLTGINFRSRLMLWFRKTSFSSDCPPKPKTSRLNCKDTATLPSKSWWRSLTRNPARSSV